MAMIGDRPDAHRERRIRARLARVIAGLDEVEQMIGRPVARFDDRAALGVPSDAVWVARPLREDLELARARVQPPHGASEVVSMAVLVNDVAFVEDAIEAVEPTVGAPGEGAGQ